LVIRPRFSWDKSLTVAKHCIVVNDFYGLAVFMHKMLGFKKNTVYGAMGCNKNTNSSGFLVPEIAGFGDGKFCEVSNHGLPGAKI